MTTKRTHNVQTPGTTPSDTTLNVGQPTDQSESKDKTVVQAVEQSLTDGTLGTNRAITGNVDNANLVSNQNEPKPEDKGAPPASRRPDYKRMRAHDIDPSTLTAPVLSADGWVMPAAREDKPRQG